MVRRPFARCSRLPQGEGEGRFGQGHHGGDAGRRLLSRHAHRHQPAQCRLDPQGIRFEVGHDRQHHLCLRHGRPRQRLQRGVRAACRRPCGDGQVRQAGRRPAHRPARVSGPRFGPAGSGRQGRRVEKLQLDARRDARRPVRSLLSGRSQNGRAGAGTLVRRGEGRVCEIYPERHDDPAGAHRAGQERRGVAHAQPQADLRVVL